MPGNKESGRKSIETQLKKLGSREALSAEMSRRSKLRKNVGGGFRDNPELAKRAREKRRENETKADEEKATAQTDDRSKTDN